jgi:uncharacterized protein (DUF983 family)
MCPACHKAGIYQGVLKVRHHCPACGFDVSAHDAGDGPAYIAICIVGTIVVLLAVWVEIAYMPALWIHVALWLPLTLIATVVVLRLAKTTLIHAQYRHNIHQFRK